MLSGISSAYLSRRDKDHFEKDIMHLLYKFLIPFYMSEHYKSESNS